MMPPNVYAILSGASAVTAIVSQRIFRTSVPEGETRPYVVWTPIANTPELSLYCAPDIDDSRVQVDCYSPSQQQATSLMSAAMSAIEAVTHVVSGPFETFEAETKLFRWTFDAEFWESR